MARVAFTRNLERHLDCPETQIDAATLREAFDAVFRLHPAIRSYILDDQQALREHVVVFLDGEPIRDRRGLTDAVGPDSEIYVMQALSGGERFDDRSDAQEP